MYLITLRYIAKRVVNFIRETPYLLKMFLKKGNNVTLISEKEAWNIINNAGYIQKKLINDIPPLLPSDIDLSIIVPVYNSEKYLEKCLNSLLNQTTKYNYEVICINDGSTDNSIEIIKSLSEKFNNLIFETQINQGISAARNAGIIKSKGKYIGFVDNDDFVSNDYVERILNECYTHNADIIQTGHDIVYPNGKLKECRKYLNCIINSGDYKSIINNTKGYIWGGCIKKELFKDLRFPLGFWFEDMVASLLFVRRANKIVIIGDPLYKYLWHGNNASATLWKAGNIKSIDQFWLAYQCAEYSINNLKLPKDNVFMEFLLREWSSMLITRTRLLSEDIHQAMFTLASCYIKRLNIDYKPQNFYIKKVYYAFLNGDYILWKNASIAMSLHNNK